MKWSNQRNGNDCDDNDMSFGRINQEFRFNNHKLWFIIINDIE